MDMLARIDYLNISTHTLTWSVTRRFYENESCSNISTHTLSWSVTRRASQEKYNVPLVKTQMKKIIVTAKTLYSHPKNVSKIYAALHTDLAW